MRPKLRCLASSESIFLNLVVPVRIDPAEGFAQGRRIHDSGVCDDFVVHGQICDFLEESFELFQAIIRSVSVELVLPPLEAQSN